MSFALIASTLVATGVSMAIVSRLRYSNPASDFEVFSFIPPIGLALMPGLIMGEIISDVTGLTAYGDRYREEERTKHNKEILNLTKGLNNNTISVTGNLNLQFSDRLTDIR